MSHTTPCSMSHSTPLHRRQAAHATHGIDPVEAVDPLDPVEAILSLPPAQRFEQMERFIGRPELEEIDLRVSERRRYPSRFVQRDEEICRLYATRRHTYGTLALQTGLSRSRIAQIVQTGRRNACRSIRPTHRAAS